MPLFERKTPQEREAEKFAKEAAKAAATSAKAEALAKEKAALEEAASALAAHVATLPKWEYHLESFDLTSHWTKATEDAMARQFTARMNALGAEGWEMVSYTSTLVYGSVSQKATGSTTVAVFKRPGLSER